MSLLHTIIFASLEKEKKKRTKMREKRNYQVLRMHQQIHRCPTKAEVVRTRQPIAFAPFRDVMAETNAFVSASLENYVL